MPATTSTTLLLCSDAACFVAQVEACNGEDIPSPLLHRLTRAFKSLANARASSARDTKRIYARVRRGLTQAGGRVRRYAALSRPRLTAACAADLKSALDGLVVDVNTECSDRGFCPIQ